MKAEIFINAIVGTLVQSYLIYRAHKIGNNVWISVFTSCLVFSALCLQILYPIRIIIDPNPLFILTKLKPYVVVNTSAILAADAIVAISLIRCLYGKRTGFRRSNDIITRLMVLTISTGGLTTCVAVASLISFMVAPLAFYDILFSFMLSKLYANSLLVMYSICSPSMILRGPGHSQDTVKNINSIPLTGLGLKSQSDEDQSQAINIVVTQTVNTDNTSTTKHPFPVEDSSADYPKIDLSPC
ncbi:hypothetical protein NM688_g3222 [Phlebia brevispora]|uniref:Uncharacterized protein n=1 Tax=Phlebia brevispora TaxID=194682 RepID=A0ACC1T6G3_9APHY|nr:hypothetical protein NM688_g3222 [Phlebia brevispora]